MSRAWVRRVSSVLLVLAVGATSAPLAAQDYDALLVLAIRTKERALESQRAEDWRTALTAFQAVDRRRPTKESKYEVGFAAEQLRELDLALESFETALDLGLSGSAGLHATEFVMTYKDQMSRVQINGPEGAKLMVRGIERGRLPLTGPLVLAPGGSLLELIEADGTRRTRSVQLAAGEHSHVDFSERVRAVEAPPSSPASPSPAPPAPTPRPEPFDAVEPKRDRAVQRTDDSTLGWVLVAAGGVVASTGVVLIPVAGSQIEENRASLRELCAVQPRPDECFTPEVGQRDAAQDRVDRIATWKGVRTAAWVGLVAGSVSTVVGAWWLATTPGDTASTAVLVPLTDGVALEWAGRF